jgi:hypothetical protein
MYVGGLDRGEDGATVVGGGDLHPPLQVSSELIGELNTSSHSRSHRGRYAFSGGRSVLRGWRSRSTALFRRVPRALWPVTIGRLRSCVAVESGTWLRWREVLEVGLRE